MSKDDIVFWGGLALIAACGVMLVVSTFVVVSDCQDKGGVYTHGICLRPEAILR
jgi:hypothetical protein